MNRSTSLRLVRPDQICYVGLMNKDKTTSSVINVSDAKARLSALLDEVASGKQLTLGKAGKPIALLIPYSGAKTERKFGVLKGQIEYLDDFEFSDSELKTLFDL